MENSTGLNFKRTMPMRLLLSIEKPSDGISVRGTYWIGLSSGKPVCGVLTLDNNKGSGQPDRWITYVHVDDLDDAIRRMQTCGGELIKGPWEVPGVGRVAMIRDPGGAEMGWVTPIP